ncbi:MAG: class I SAM-dependent methyltransferase [Cyanobacteria bacterium]|nr:class I SAM-dependent methyltransferase [Cyanobacteriota bacterium]
MTFKLPTTAEKHEYVREQFDRIARRYDLTNDVISFCMHRAWKKKAIRALINGSIEKKPFSKNVEGSEKRFLDVCCGTGDLALRLASLSEVVDEVVGLDFSSEMLAIAERRESEMRSQPCCASYAQHDEHAGTAHDTHTPISLSKVSWIAGDAENLPFKDDHFDGAIISFGLRNLTDLKRGLAEMSRVVRPGGYVVNLDLGRPDGAVFAPLFKLFFHKVVPMIGAVLQNDMKAYTYLPESMTTYPDPEKITEFFQSVGMSPVKHYPLAGGSVALHVGCVTRD